MLGSAPDCDIVLPPHAPPRCCQVELGPLGARLTVLADPPPQRNMVELAVDGRGQLPIGKVLGLEAGMFITFDDAAFVSIGGPDVERQLSFHLRPVPETVPPKKSAGPPPVPFVYTPSLSIALAGEMLHLRPQHGHEGLFDEVLAVTGISYTFMRIIAPLVLDAQLDEHGASHAWLVLVGALGDTWGHCRANRLRVGPLPRDEARTLVDALERKLDLPRPITAVGLDVLGRRPDASGENSRQFVELLGRATVTGWCTSMGDVTLDGHDLGLEDGQDYRIVGFLYATRLEHLPIGRWTLIPVRWERL